MEGARPTGASTDRVDAARIVEGGGIEGGELFADLEHAGIRPFDDEELEIKLTELGPSDIAASFRWFELEWIERCELPEASYIDGFGGCLLYTSPSPRD